MTEIQSRPWFAPKTYGYGATPITWEGWALVVAFVAAIVLAAWFLIVRPALAGTVPSILAVIAFIIIDAVLVGGLIITSKAKSSADWHWRWGANDK